MAGWKNIQVNPIAQTVTVIMQALDMLFCNHLEGWTPNNNGFKFKYLYKKGWPDEVEVLLKPKLWPKEKEGYINLVLISFSEGFWTLKDGRISAPHIPLSGCGFFCLPFTMETNHGLEIRPRDINTPEADFVLKLNGEKKTG